MGSNPVSTGQSSARPPIGELLAEELPPLSWLWEPFVPKGSLVLLAGDPKVGKSTFVYALVVAVVQGRPFLGYPVKQTLVLILALEEHRREVRARLQRFGVRPDDPLVVHTGRLRSPGETIPVLTEFVARQGIGLVVMDTLSRWWSIEDENDNVQVTRALDPLLRLAHETGVTVLLVHHARKPGPGDRSPAHAVRGASALVASVDQALVLSRDKTRRRLDTIGRYAETPERVRYELVGTEFRRVDGAEAPPGEHRRGAEAEARVLAALGEHPSTVRELSDRTGLGEKAIRSALERLGPRVVREGRGVRGNPVTYRLTGQDAKLPDGASDRS